MSHPTMIINRISRWICLVWVATLLLPAFCFGQQRQSPMSSPKLSLLPPDGPPTSQTLVSGSGFASNLRILIYFDSTQEATVTTNSSGQFANVAISVPDSALPGEHMVRATSSAGGNGASAQFLVNTDWAQSGFGPRHLRVNPYENVLNKQAVRGMSLLWYFGNGCSSSSEVAVANQMAYCIGEDTNLYAINASTGAYQWKFSPGSGRWVAGTPAVVDGVVYVTTSGFNGELQALNASTGSELWSAPLGDEQDLSLIVSAPAVVNGRVFVGSNDGHLYAVSAFDGSPLWASPTPVGVNVSTPAVGNGVVYFATWNGYVYAVTANNGSLAWRSSYNSGFGEWNAAPAVSGGLVYMGSSDGNLYALSVQDGHQVWNYSTGAPVNSSPAVANGLVYISSEDSNVYALNASTGAYQWRYTTGGEVISSSTVANGVLYFASFDGNLYALNASTGAYRWSSSTGGGAVSSPAVANGIVYIGGGDGFLRAFGLTNGTQP